MQSIDLAPDERECLQQLFYSGPTSDGDLVSKAGRTGLVDRGYAERCNGWQQLTSAGFELAVRAGLGDDKERRDNRRRRDDNDRHRAMVALLDRWGGSFVVFQEDRSADIDMCRDKSGFVRFTLVL